MTRFHTSRIIPVAVLALAAGLPAATAVAAPAAAATTYTITDLGSLGLGVSDGLAINANGQVTGYSYLSKQIQVSCPPRQYGQQKKCYINPYHAFLYSNGTMNDLGTLGGNNSKGLGINLSGEVVGFAQTSTDADHGFLWSNGTMTDLGLNFFPAAVNDNGVVVGGNQIYSGGTLQNLNNLIPAGSPYQIQYATAINDNGQIVANAYDTATNQGHALLLNPS